ncbi:MAG: hypothetical protein V5A62_04635 [Haloarculaceae archaeon]
MKRRTVIRLAAASLAGLAGCVSAGDGSAPGSTETPVPAESSTPPSTEPPTSSPTPTPDPPRIVDRSFEVIGRECGTGEGGAHTTLDASWVVIEATAVGSNGCATARLGEASYDPEADTLSAVVEVYQPDDATACTQCLTDIDYRASVGFEGGTPGSVRVVHDSEVVTETEVG